MELKRGTHILLLAFYDGNFFLHGLGFRQLEVGEFVHHRIELGLGFLRRASQQVAGFIVHSGLENKMNCGSR